MFSGFFSHIHVPILKCHHEEIAGNPVIFDVTFSWSFFPVPVLQHYFQFELPFFWNFLKAVYTTGWCLPTIQPLLFHYLGIHRETRTFYYRCGPKNLYPNPHTSFWNYWYHHMEEIITRIRNKKLLIRITVFHQNILQVWVWFPGPYQLWIIINSPRAIE